MKHLLVVEDEPQLRMLYQTELEAEGYKAGTAADASEAVQKNRGTRNRCRHPRFEAAR